MQRGRTACPTGIVSNQLSQQHCHPFKIQLPAALRIAVVRELCNQRLYDTIEYARAHGGMKPPNEV